jgi:hypothetical protein
VHGFIYVALRAQLQGDTTIALMSAHHCLMFRAILLH